MKLYVYSKRGENSHDKKIKLRIFYKAGENILLSAANIKKYNYKQHELDIYPSDLTHFVGKAEINSSKLKPKKFSKELPITDFNKCQSSESSRVLARPFDRTQRAAALFSKPIYVINDATYHKLTRHLDFSQLSTSNTDKKYISVGSASDRETILFDPSAMVLNACYQGFRLSLTSKKIPRVLGKILEAFDKQLIEIFGVSNAGTVDACESLIKAKLNHYSTVKDDIGGEHPVVLLKTFIENKKGVCRHRALFAAYIIGRLVQNSLLPKGSVAHRRGNLIDRKGASKGAHAWVCYEVFENEATGQKKDFLIYDPMWSKGATNKAMAYPISLYNLEHYAWAVNKYGQQTIRILEPFDVQKTLIKKMKATINTKNASKAAIIEVFKAWLALDDYYQGVFKSDVPTLGAPFLSACSTSTTQSKVSSPSMAINKNFFQDKLVEKMLKVFSNNETEGELRLLIQVKRLLDDDYRVQYESALIDDEDLPLTQPYSYD